MMILARDCTVVGCCKFFRSIGKVSCHCLFSSLFFFLVSAFFPFLHFLSVLTILLYLIC